jgi:hypothetical protein
MLMRELVKDIGRLEMELHRFETRFGVKSQDFYTAMMQGELEEFDALDEHRMEFIEWLALYKTWLSLDEKYHQLIARQPVALQIKTNLELAYA